MTGGHPRKNTTPNTPNTTGGHPSASAPARVRSSRDKQPATLRDENAPTPSMPAPAARVAASNQSADLAPFTASQSANALKDKDEEIRRLRELLAAKETPGTTEEEIELIPRPKGKAGDKKKGFRLIEAMELDGSREDEALYYSILSSVRRNITRVGLDLNVCYRHQDTEKLLNVFKLTRKDFPYLTKKRFPADWATAEIVKQYLWNQRKETKRKLKQAQDGCRHQRTRRHIDNIPSDEDDEQEEPNTGEDD